MRIGIIVWVIQFSNWVIFSLRIFCLIPMGGPKRILNKAEIHANWIQILWTTLYIYIYIHTFIYLYMHDHWE